MKKPSKIRIGPYDWKVSYYGLEEYDLRRKYGHTDRFNIKMEICDATQDQCTADTVIHEVLHAIWFSKGISGDKADEEDIVTPLATGLAQVIRDNPDLIKWLQESLK